MKTVLKALRFGVETMLTAVQRAEDHHPDDYRLSDLRTGLWQASQALKELIAGDFDSHRKRAHIAAQPSRQALPERYAAELIPDSSVPVRSTSR